VPNNSELIAVIIAIIVVIINNLIGSKNKYHTKVNNLFLELKIFFVKKTN
jgi:hypothetical protein